MCNPSNLGRIASVVEDYVGSRRLFTALQISREVQRQATQAGEEFEPHRHLRNAIHREMQNYLQSGPTGGDYAQMTVHIEEGSERFSAELFYPVECDTPEDTYKEWLRNNTIPSAMDVNRRPAPVAPASDPAVDPNVPATVAAIASVPAVAVPAPAAAPKPRNSPLQKTNRIADDRGTVSVPSDLVTAIGLTARSTAHCYRHPVGSGNVLVITKDEIPVGTDGFEKLTEYTVDDHLNIRITHAQLVVAELTNEQPGIDTFDLQIEGGQIIMQRHA